MAECAVIMFNSPTVSGDKVNVGKLVECSVDVGQVSWDDGCKNSDAVGTCDLAAPICPEMWSMWAEVASGNVLSFGGVRLSWPADDRAVIGTKTALTYLG